VRNDDDAGDAEDDGCARARAIAARMDGYTDERTTMLGEDGWKRSSHVETDERNESNERRR